MQTCFSLVNSMPLPLAALAYVELFGIPVFRLQPGSKEPLPYSHAVREATLDPATVRRWWQEMPSANIGLAGGFNFDWVDLDEKQGRSGIRSWSEVDPEFFRRPIQRTPNGGLHVVTPAQRWLGLKNFQNKGLSGGVDLRTDGGYIVGAPSWMPAGQYQWQDGELLTPSAALSEALLRWSTEGKGTSYAQLVPPAAEDLTSFEVDLHLSTLPKDEQAFLSFGGNWRDDQDDSTAMWQCILTMFLRGWNKSRVAAILPHTYCMDVAERHASGDPWRWLWRYTITNAWHRAQAILTVQESWLDTQEKAPSDEEGGGDDGENARYWIGAPEQRQQENPAPEQVSPGSNDTELTPFQLAIQRARALDDRADGVHRQCEGILRSVIGQGLEDADKEDLFRTLKDNGRVTLSWLRETWRRITADVRQQRVRDGEEVPEIFIANQNRLLNRISMTYRNKEAFLIERAPEFDGDKNEAEQYYLKGDNRKCPVVDSATYNPGKPHGVFTDSDDGVMKYNFFRAGPVVPAPGDPGPWLDLLRSFDLEGGKRVEDAVLDYLAFMIQNPGTKINHALLLGGEHGVGKDSLVYPILEILGQHNVQNVRGDELLSDFTSYLARKKLLVIQEVEYGDHKDGMRVSAKLKPILASPPHTLRINEKNLPEYETPNLLQVIAFTNDRSHPVHMDHGERRWLCAWAQRQRTETGSETEQQWQTWFFRYYDWLESGGIATIYHYLLNRDVSGYNPKRAPMNTPWTLQIQTAGRTMLEDWLADQIAFKQGIFHFDVVRIPDILPLARMAQKSGELGESGPITLKKIGMALTKLGARSWKNSASRWRVVRNAKTVRETGLMHWRAIFDVIDAKGIEAAIHMTPVERVRYSMDARSSDVIDLPVTTVEAVEEYENIVPQTNWNSVEPGNLIPVQREEAGLTYEWLR